MLDQVRIFFRNIRVGIQNLIYYYPVISHCLKTVWKDRYWDYEYFFLQFLKFQLISTRDGILKEDLIVGAPNVADEINHMLELINVYEHYDDIFEGNNQEMIEQIGILGLDEESKNERIKNYVIKLNMFEHEKMVELMTYKEFMYNLLYVSRYISYLKPRNIIDRIFLLFWQIIWYTLEKYTLVGE